MGGLFTIELGDPTATTISIERDRESYLTARSEVEREYGSPAVDELPGPQSYVIALLAGGLIEPANRDEIVEFLERYGSPYLNAGDKSVVAGFDTKLPPNPWRACPTYSQDPRASSTDTHLRRGSVTGSTGITSEATPDPVRRPR
jgi:hypothetical protein